METMESVAQKTIDETLSASMFLLGMFGMSFAVLSGFTIYLYSQEKIGGAVTTGAFSALCLVVTIYTCCIHTVWRIANLLNQKQQS